MPVTLFLLSADGPLPDPSMVRQPGPNQMVNRMQGPGIQLPMNRETASYLRSLKIRKNIVPAQIWDSVFIQRFQLIPLSLPLYGGSTKKHYFLSGMNQFNQMGMPSMGQRSTPPLPMGASGNQVSALLYFVLQTALKFHFKSLVLQLIGPFMVFLANMLT